MARVSLHRLSPRRRWVLASLALIVAAAAVAALVVVTGALQGRPEGIPAGPPGAASIADAADYEPFAFEEESPDELVERAGEGLSHPLYALSPGGAAASAERTARFRAVVEAAAARHGVEADTLEALVLLESAGRPDVAAGDDPEGAVGVAQILPGTATALLGMSVDLSASKRLTASIERERRRARRADSASARRKVRKRLAALERRRRAADERYDPSRSLEGAARYLEIAERRFGREDLAVASYHMGIGNLERVVEAYVSPARPEPATSATVTEHDLSYARLFFDSSPLENPRTHALLAGYGDDSRTYPFRIEAAREIMRLHRGDPDELARRERLHALWPSGELALRPPEESEPYASAGDLSAAFDEEDLVRLPRDPARLGFTPDPALGQLSLGPAPGRPALYRGLRPEALATLLYITKEVRRIAGVSGLTVTDAVRDTGYGGRLRAVRATGEPARSFDPHSTGYAFDIARRYPNRRVGPALAHILDRLRALRVLDYAYEPRELHIGVGPDAERLLPLQEALVPAR